MLVGKCAAPEGWAMTGGVHWRVGTIKPTMLPATVGTGRGVDESVVITGGVGSSATADLWSKWKAAATDRRARKSHTCVSL